MCQVDEDEAAKAKRQEDAIADALERAAAHLDDEQIEVRPRTAPSADRFEPFREQKMKERLLERALARLDHPDDDEFECAICYETKDDEDESILPCGHFYCACA